MDEFICSVANKIVHTPHLLVFPPSKIPSKDTSSNIEANRNYSDRLNSAIELYAEKLQTQLASFHSLNSEMQEMVARTSKKVYDSSSDNLIEDWQMFSRLRLDSLKPIVDSKNHKLGMGLYNESKQEFAVYDTLGELLNNRPRERISANRGIVQCKKCKNDREVQAFYYEKAFSTLKGDELPRSSLGCQLL
jgi:hypothetical protein